GQFDVDAKVVRIEFQLVCRREPAILCDVHRQGGNWTIDTECPVPVLLGTRLEVDRCSPHNPAPTLSNVGLCPTPRLGRSRGPHAPLRSLAAALCAAPLCGKENRILVSSRITF